MTKKKVYVKKLPKNIDRLLYGPQVIDNYAFLSGTLGLTARFILQLAPFLSIGAGLIMIFSVFYPIAEYQLRYLPQTVRREILRPMQTLEKMRKEEKIQNKQVLASVSEIDTSDPKNWFPKGTFKSAIRPVITNYTISIPKLGIKDANVEVGGTDLKKSLIHYGASSLPGDYGNAVIFGHSTLPVFYSPKVYETIFSTLPTLKKGDEIYARVDSIKYRYVVYDMQTVTPEELSILEQKYDRFDMTLVTCVPPGTKIMRLSVKARLEDL